MVFGIGEQKKQGFPRVYNASDFNAGSGETDIEVTTGKWNKIGYVLIPAQQRVAFGVGVTTSGGLDSREYVKVRFDSTGGSEISGVYRFAVTDHNEMIKKTVKEERSENLTGGTTVKLGESRPLAREDSYLVLELKPDSTTTLDYSDADNVVLMPVTVYQ